MYSTTNFMIYMILLTMIIVNVSCENEAIEKTKISYTATRSLEPHKVTLQGAEIFYPSGIDVLDSNLLIIDSSVDSGKFKIFDLDNFHLVASFGIGGNGPDEFSHIIQQPVSSTERDRVQIFDWSNKRLDIYNIGSETNEFTYSKVGEFTLPPQLMLSQ